MPSFLKLKQKIKACAECKILLHRTEEMPKGAESIGGGGDAMIGFIGAEACKAASTACCDTCREAASSSLGQSYVCRRRRCARGTGDESARNTINKLGVRKGGCTMHSLSGSCGSQKRRPQAIVGKQRPALMRDASHT